MVLSKDPVTNDSIITIIVFLTLSAIFVVIFFPLYFVGYVNDVKNNPCFDDFISIDN